MKEKLEFASLLLLVEVRMSMQSKHLCEDIRVFEKEKDIRSFTTICAFTKLTFQSLGLKWNFIIDLDDC